MLLLSINKNKVAKGKQMTTEKTYNGWKNRATWNLVLWAENDYELYKWIRENKISSLNRLKKELQTVSGYLEKFKDETPDGYRWDDPTVSESEVDNALIEMVI